MQSQRISISFAIALLVCACSSTRIQTDFDRQADFSSYSTFAWYQPAETEKSPTEGPNQLVDQRIRGAISQNLRAKGLEPSETNEADLLVTYYTSLNSQMHFHTTGWGYGYGWGWGPYWGHGYGFWPGWTHTNVRTYHEGTVIIDIIDRGENQLVWRGVGTSVVGKKSHSEEKIGQSMTRILEGFPPA
jgi:hypothetical protein